VTSATSENEYYSIKIVNYNPIATPALPASTEAIDAIAFRTGFGTASAFCSEAQDLADAVPPPICRACCTCWRERPAAVPFTLS
jgi:hypothetical protein